MIDSNTRLIYDSLALKTEIADGYAELAEQLESFNNPEAAATFMQLADKQHQHILRLEILASEQLSSADQSQPPCIAQPSPIDDINALSHYLMTPYHAIELAIHIERTTQQNLQTRLGITDDDVRDQPQQLEHSRHLHALQQLLNGQPRPESGWDEDQDPPFLDD